MLCGGLVGSADTLPSSSSSISIVSTLGPWILRRGARKSPPLDPCVPAAEGRMLVVHCPGRRREAGRRPWPAKPSVGGSVARRSSTATEHRHADINGSPAGKGL